MAIIERKIKADHKHLVDYLENSMRFSPIPMPAGERDDMVYDEIQISALVFSVITEKPAVSILVITKDGVSTVKIYRLPVFLQRWAMFDKEEDWEKKIDMFLSGYKPDASPENNKYYK
ncbi:MAG: hypothetical protein IJ410_01990 [Oscillospiraceae bacterium]|nr:hypothetical protein [Oscillospiraceae bacterium]